MTQNNTKNNFNVTRKIKDYTHRQLAIAKLKKSKIVFPAEPRVSSEWLDEDGAFKMPEDITAVDYRDLGRLLGALNSLLMWYGAVLASTKVDLITAERVKEFTEAQVRMQILSDEKMMKDFKAREDKEAYVNMNEMVIQAQDWYDTQKSLVTMTEQIYADYQRSFQMVSREITRRSGEIDNELREGNIK